MVKHQRRSHQRGVHSSELDDCSSDSGSEDAPSTPRSFGAVAWPAPGDVMQHDIPHGHPMHRSASFADFGQHINGYPMQQQYAPVHRHRLSGGAPELHGQPVSEPHPGVQMMHRTASMPQPYYVTEQNNHEVATMNTHHPMQPHYQIPRQQVDRMEIPYTAAALNTPIQGSPSAFSASARSPAHHEPFYTHQPPSTTAFALQTSPPIEQQGPIVQYQQGMPQQMSPQPVQPQQQIPFQAPRRRQQPPQTHEQYQPPAQPEEQWYSSVPYQPPVEVATIGQIPTYGSGIYDPWGPKLDFEDPSMQMPSAPIENM